MAKKDLLTRIVCHDGDKIFHMQEIAVPRSGMAWKQQLQSTIASRLSLSVHQISIFVVSGDPDVAAANPAAHKLPPNALLDPNCYILALIRQSPNRIRTRTSRSRQISPEKSTPERILLRPDPSGGCYSPSSAQVGTTRLPNDHLMQLYLAQRGASWHPDDAAQTYRAQAAMYASHDAQFQNQYLVKYRSSMANSQQSASLLRSAPYDSGRADPNDEKIAVCDVCQNSKRQGVPEFHLCKNERVLGPTEWRDDFGSIGEPRRG